MTDDIRSLSDKDLAAGARVSGWRRRLHERAPAAGCLAAVLLALTTVYAGYQYAGLDAIPLAFFLVLIGMVAFFSVTRALEFIAAGSGRAHVHELRRRCGMLPLKAYIREEQENSGCALSILASGTGLPLGRHRFVRIRFLHSLTTEIESFVAKQAEISWVDGPLPRDLAVHRQTTLNKDQADRIRGLATGLAYGQSESYPGTCVDGFPCRMAVIDHAEDKIYRLECNLAGLPEPAATRPPVMLLREIMQAAESLSRDETDRQSISRQPDTPAGHERESRQYPPETITR